MKLAWLTDIHLNFVSSDEQRRLSIQLADSAADAFVIGGDIAEADSFTEALQMLADCVQRPVYFVLGNHDYYRSSIAAVRDDATQLTANYENLHWLPQSGVVSFDNTNTVLIGHGGWGDGRAGNFFESEVLLNDYLMIDEFREVTGDVMQLDNGLPKSLYNELNKLGDESAAYFQQTLPDAFRQSDNVIVLMHVPPFREACWHEGQTSDDNWAPHFVCHAAGEVIKMHAAANPDKRITILCGHTHGSGTADILPNLHVITGGVEYGHPQIQQLFDIS